MIRCQTGLKKADAHWTDHRGQALIIKTADCLPVFIADQRRIMGLHMGWRAFTNNIFEKAMEHFDIPSRTQIFIGPHIGFQSFQVDSETTQRILNAQALNLQKALQIGIAKTSLVKTNHFYIDLLSLLVRKVKQSRIGQIHLHPVDTYLSSTHYSHRRNRWRQGTNYSFILKS